MFEAARNTYATLYNGVCQRDWFVAQARGYRSTLEAALHVHNIPTSVVETLIAATRARAAALQRYHRLRKRALGLDRYFLFDIQVPLVDAERRVQLRRGPRVGRSSRSPRWARRTARACGGASAAAASTSTRTTANGAARTRRPCTACTRTCCSTTTTRSTRSSRWPTRWATTCTRCWRTRTSRSCTRTTRSSWPKCRRR